MKRLGFVLPPPLPGKDASPLQGYLSPASNLFVIIYPPKQSKALWHLSVQRGEEWRDWLACSELRTRMKKVPLPNISLLLQISVPGDASTGFLWWLHTNPSKMILRRICMESSKHNVAYTCIPTPICTKGLSFSEWTFFILFFLDVPTNSIISQTEFSWHHHSSSLLPWNTTQWPQPELEPRPLYLESSILVTKPPSSTSQSTILLFSMTWHQHIKKKHKEW